VQLHVCLMCGCSALGCLAGLQAQCKVPQTLLLVVLHDVSLPPKDPMRLATYGSRVGEHVRQQHCQQDLKHALLSVARCRLYTAELPCNLFSTMPVVSASSPLHITALRPAVSQPA
jgi:hypothetical protein